MAIPKRKTYLLPMRERMSRPYPDNRAGFIDRHGHSAPAGCKAPPAAAPFWACLHRLRRLVRHRYSFAGLRTIGTAVGGENRAGGARRSEGDMRCHMSDVPAIDYARSHRQAPLTASEAGRWFSTLPPRQA